MSCAQYYGQRSASMVTEQNVGAWQSAHPYD